MEQIPRDMSPGSDCSRGQAVQDMFENQGFHNMNMLPFGSRQAQIQDQAQEQSQDLDRQQPQPHHPYMHLQQQRRRSQPHLYPGAPTWHANRPHPHFVATYGNPFFAQQHHPSLMIAHPHKHVTETKPRFAKHEVEVLEAEFQKNHKPNSIVKRGLADKMGVEVPRINNWFQNRRAREKHDIKLREYEKQQREEHKRSPAETSPAPSSRSGKVSRQADSRGDSESAEVCAYQPAILTAVMGGDDADVEEAETASSHDQTPAMTSCDEVSDIVSANSSPVMGQDAQFTPASELGEFNFGPAFSDFQGQSPYSNQDSSGVHQSMYLRPFSDAPAFHSLPSAPYLPFGAPTLPSESFLPTAMPFNDGYPFESREIPTLSMSQSPPPPSAPAELSVRPQRTIAERRKRQRPAALGDSAKSSRSQGPRTGIEMGRRPDASTPMRRAASATGMYPLGISKSSSGSSSGYTVKQESVLHGLQLTDAPTVRILNTSSLSPRSPGIRELSPETSYSADDQHALPFGGLDMRFMHTPPKTPGLQLNLQPHTFNMTAEQAFSQGLDESVVTPGLVRDGSEMDFPDGTPGGYHPVPRYAASQPVTPGLPPHNFGPSYMWGPQLGPGSSSAAAAAHATATEYRFPDSSAPSSCYVDSSALSSPDSHHHHQLLHQQHQHQHHMAVVAPTFQFAQNITPQDFRAEF